MSASRDKNQKCAFIYSNLYKVYQNEKEGLLDKDALQKSPHNVLKGAVLGPIQGLRPGLKIHAYKPIELSQKSKIVSVGNSKNKSSPAVTIESLKKGLQELEGLHHKLHFMLEDLEEYLNKK